ncbi:MAG: hypothetical protein MUP71_11670 [Candidatus Aminicenantes bacterium]|nr:hypothetical protein [Candidatus Aminicenantes bacterium]
MENKNVSKEPISSNDEISMENKNKSNLLSESLFIFIIPILGYLYAYLYEMGYCIYFKIPSELIIITFSNLTISGVYVAIIFLGFTIVIQLILGVEQSSNNFISKHKNVIVSIFKIILVSIYFLFLLFPIGYADLILSATILIAVFVWLYNSQKSKDCETNYILFIFNIPNIRNEIKLAFIFILLTLSGFFFIRGIMNAKQQKEFLTFNLQKEMVVLRVYNNNVICVPLDRLKKKIILDYSIVNILESSISLKLEKVGPLQPFKVGYFSKKKRIKTKLNLKRKKDKDSQNQ